MAFGLITVFKIKEYFEHNTPVDSKKKKTYDLLVLRPQRFQNMLMRLDTIRPTNTGSQRFKDVYRSIFVRIKTMRENQIFARVSEGRVHNRVLRSRISTHFRHEAGFAPHYLSPFKCINMQDH